MAFKNKHTHCAATKRASGFCVHASHICWPIEADCTTIPALATAVFVLLSLPDKATARAIAQEVHMTSPILSASRWGNVVLIRSTEAVAMIASAKACARNVFFLNSCWDYVGQWYSPNKMKE